MSATVEQPGLNETVDLVFFSAGGLILAVESVKVRDLREAAGSDAPTLAALLRLPDPANRATPGRQRLLRLIRPDGILAARVDEPVIQDRLPASALHPLPPLLEARLTLPGVQALARWRCADGDTLAILLDPYRLPVS